MILPKLAEEVRSMVQQGIYSLYSIEGTDEFVLYAPASHPCCSSLNHPPCYWLLNAEGEVIRQIPDMKGMAIKAALHL